ncbi:MAG: branched-chain amino acid ABC transporter permease [Acidimicrobiales bacterium]
MTQQREIQQREIQQSGDRHRREHLLSLAGPIALAVVVALVASFFSRDIELQFRLALVVSAMVVAIHTFTGLSGVISFGHISFVAIGAFTAGLMSLGSQQKQAVFPELFGFIADNEVGNITSLALATVLAALFALIVGAPLMRLNGLSAGIATFAILGITRNVLRNWTKIGPGAKTIPGVPETTDLLQATVGLVLVIIAAWAYQQSRFGRRLRATREDPAASQSVGISTYRERLLAFTLSGAIGGFAGGLYVHHLGSITTEQVYLDLTFLTLAMLVVGGMGSLWGAVLGGLVVSGLSSFLAEAEKGVTLLGLDLTFPQASRNIILGALMALVLLLRPRGLTGGREFTLGARTKATRPLR